MTASAALRALGTTAFVAVTDAPALPSARALLVRRLNELDLACSRFRADSELAEVNRHAGAGICVSALLAETVAAALEAARSTDGIVDPTLGVELRAAGYDRTFAVVRARDGWTLRRLGPRTATWRDVELDRERRVLRVPHGLELDLGATAKAWAADELACEIAAQTGAGALVALGGDIAVAGASPQAGWAVRIADDHSACLDSPGPVVAIVSGGLATSGTAVRRWRTNRGDAHHVIDPRSRRPAVTPWRTVTVAAATCLAANIAATAALVLGAAGADWLAARQLPARLVRNDGVVTHTGDWPEEAEAA
jgi:thiamine biosynthesis lipoprotein ApbE